MMSVLIGFCMFLLVLSIGVAVSISFLALLQLMLDVLENMREKRTTKTWWMRNRRMQRAARKGA